MDRKSAAGLATVIELKNAFIGDIEHDWQGNRWSAWAIDRRWRNAANLKPNATSSLDAAASNA
jgi:hypothetical protein